MQIRQLSIIGHQKTPHTFLIQRKQQHSVSAWLIYATVSETDAGPKTGFIRWNNTRTPRSGAISQGVLSFYLSKLNSMPEVKIRNYGIQLSAFRFFPINASDVYLRTKNQGKKGNIFLRVSMPGFDPYSETWNASTAVTFAALSAP